MLDTGTTAAIPVGTASAAMVGCEGARWTKAIEILNKVPWVLSMFHGKSKGPKPKTHKSGQVKGKSILANRPYCGWIYYPPSPKAFLLKALFPGRGGIGGVDPVNLQCYSMFLPQKNCQDPW